MNKIGKTTLRKVREYRVEKLKIGDKMYYKTNEEIEWWDGKEHTRRQTGRVHITLIEGERKKRGGREKIWGEINIQEGKNMVKKRGKKTKIIARK